MSQSNGSPTGGGLEPGPVNSREFYDHQFALGAWERNNGPQQTRYFMSRIVDALPAPESAHLRDNALSILDWGCALGDGLDVLKAAFPKCTLTGLDFSARAIAKGRSLYPHHKFLRGDRVEGEFDAIITSNCLEHFDAPLQVFETLLQASRQLCIALVPFEEAPLCEGHVATFGPETFPSHLSAWTCIDARVVEMDPVYWNGPQLLVVYGSQSYLSETGRAPIQDLQERLATESAKRRNTEAFERWHTWLDHPVIAEHYRERALIDGVPWPFWAIKAMGGTAERSLELGCRSGSRSFHVHGANAARVIEGFDEDQALVAEAERMRIARNIPGSFRVEDSNSSTLPVGKYGLIFSCHRFHQFSRLEHIMEQVHESLLPNGLFVLESYVGPARFQWTDQQMELAQSLMTLVPRPLRRFRGDAIKNFEGRPTVAEVSSTDPSRSPDILPLFEKYFEIVALKKLGGTIQSLIYNGIVHNFDAGDLGALACVRAIIEVEDTMIDSGLLPSDFVLLIGRRRSATV